jgi:hypothetical protein
MSWRMEKSSSLGMPMHPNKYPRSTNIKAWGCPRGTPSSSAKKLGHLWTHYIFIASCIMRFSWSVSCFSFQFTLVLFAAINGWTPTNFFWWSFLAFHLSRTLRFSLLSFNKCSLFFATAFSFWFSPWFFFRSCYIFSSRCILTSGPCWFSSKELFKKVRMVLEKRKKFMQKSGTKRSLCRLRLRILHVVLDVFLIVLLVVLL